jgi:hypothetical protein
MKLDEIINTNVQHKEIDTTFGRTDGYGWEDRDKDDKLGSGLYYAAYDDEDDPHMIKKISTQPTYPSDGKDGNEEYIAAIVKHKLSGNNIWVPRVYDFTTIKDANRSKHYEFTLERLVESGDVMEDEVMGGIMNAFGPSFEYESKDRSQDARHITDEVGKHIHWMIRTKDISTDNPDLTEAIEVLAEACGKYTSRIDLHWGNIMYRRTPYGAQLVINDPLV